MSVMLPLMLIFEQGGKFFQSVKYACELAGLRPELPRLSFQLQTCEEMRELEKMICNLEMEISKN